MFALGARVEARKFQLYGKLYALVIAALKVQPINFFSRAPITPVEGIFVVKVQRGREPLAVAAGFDHRGMRVQVLAYLLKKRLVQIAHMAAAL